MGLRSRPRSLRRRIALREQLLLRVHFVRTSQALLKHPQNTLATTETPSKHPRLAWRWDGSRCVYSSARTSGALGSRPSSFLRARRRSCPSTSRAQALVGKGGWRCRVHIAAFFTV